MKTSRAPKTTSRKTVAIRLTGESSGCQHPFLAKRHWLTPGATFTEHYLHRMRSKRLSPLKPLWTGWKESGRAATALSLKRPTRLLGTPTALFGQPPARSAGTSLTFALPTTRNRGLQGSRVFFERDGTDIWNLNTSKPVFGCMEMWECMWLCRFIFLVYIYIFFAVFLLFFCRVLKLAFIGRAFSETFSSLSSALLQLILLLQHLWLTTIYFEDSWAPYIRLREF